jgi:hypothetical protein|tara:strand:- start:6 stop:194 length:189 start_codon:yes stop_codon:yes gene_type:complete
MPQIGSNENPVMFRKAIVSKDSRFRKGFDKKKYDENYDKIFKKNSEFESCRAKSKTFESDQD